MSLENLEQEMRNIVGDHVYTSREQLIPFLSDASYFTGDLPMMVVMPGNAREVSEIMKACTRTRTPAVVRGGGTSLTGSSILKGEGIIISMNRFDRVIEKSIADKYVIAEPGVRLDDLNAGLEADGHFYPPDPASSRSATVGGSLSTNAGGLRAAMYGTTKNWVLGLEAVLPSGEIVQLGGKTLKRTAGYDLTSLMVGAEGTLGIITKAILKIWPLPEARGRAVAYFRSIEPVGESVSEVKRRGITPMIAEFIDSITMASITRIHGMEFPEGCKYMIIMDVASTRESIDRELEDLASVLREFDPIAVTTTKDSAEMELMYQARKGAYGALLTERTDPSQRVVIGDIVVPATHLADALTETRRKMDELGIKSGLIGHAGDGNIHANIYARISDADEMKRIEEFQMEFGRIAIRHGGSVSAEHGIGLEKIDLLEEEFRMRDSMGTLELMKQIRNLIDPLGLLNRGKMLK